MPVGQSLQTPPKTERLVGHRTEIFFGQRDHAPVIGHRRQHIDKTKQLRLEVEVMHREIDGRLGPPLSFEESGGLTGGEPGEFFADVTDRGFQVIEGSSHDRGLHIGGRKCLLCSVYTAVFSDEPSSQRIP